VVCIIIEKLYYTIHKSDFAFLFRLGHDPPEFHYESRQFSVVQCNTDLNENDLELTIVRGIAYNVANPKDVDTYVKFEFPYPQVK
jgi:hypothetical protein